MEVKGGAWLVTSSTDTKLSLMKRLSSIISLQEVLTANARFEASAYNIDTRKVVDAIRLSKFPFKPLYGLNGLSSNAHNAFRFKRIYVAERYGVPFLSSSDIINLKPQASHFLSKKWTERIDELAVNKWDVLISCSGTVGNIAIAGDSISGNALSQHVIRLRTEDPDLAGYIAGFLRSRFGRPQLTGASYGSVVSHIEPEHLRRVLIPDIPPPLVKSIGGDMRKATELRDQANRLLDEANTLLHHLLGLEALQVISGSTCRSIKFSSLTGRFEASYHSLTSAKAESTIAQLPFEIASVGDFRISKEVRPITKFRKRVYVQTGGIPFLSSKQLFQYDPVEVKGLAKGAHEKDLAEIALQENMLVVTRSGTIGKVQIIPRYMSGWAGSEDAIRIIAADSINPGYLYAWLASAYGYLFITRQTYGSVILHIDLEQLSSVPFPLPPSPIINEIGDIVLKANSLRNDAWNLEKVAITKIESLIQAN